MKKFLLFLLVMLAIAGTTLAQDIWVVGYRINSTTGKKDAVSYKNGISSCFVSSETTDLEGVDVATKSNGTSYWAVNGTTSSTVFGLVYECGTTGSPILNTGNDAMIHDLIPYNNELYAAGYKVVDGNNVACFWNINGTDPRILGTSGYNSAAYCGLLRPAGSGVICAGYQYDSDGYHGVIWRFFGSTSVIHTFDVGTRIYGITFYNGYYYTVGTAVVDGQTKLRVWKTDQNTGSTTLVYTILENNVLNPTKCKICIAGGDCYVSGQEGTLDKIWKNGQELYSTTGYYFNMTTNGDGLYYVGRASNEGKVWKDGEELYSISSAEFLKGITVAAPECEDESVRTLPFFDGFESGETQWNCWTKIDVDDDNGNNLASYWDLGGEFTEISSFVPHTGDHYAKHHRNTETAQEGWLVSPRLFLQPGRDATTLTYYSRNGGSYVEGYGSVWISTSSDPTNLSAYTQIYSEPNNKSDWAQRTVSLNAYQGQAVYIAFRYYAEPSGGSIPAYYIDDVSVTEDWDDGGVFDVPYEQQFVANPGEQEPGYCWYILDNDHTGDLKCWQWDASSECAKHPDGQNNGINQEGWMFTPTFELESGLNYSVTFDTKYTYTSYANNQSSLWIALDQTGVPDPADYTTMIWEETNATTDWVTQTIDLSSYAGHDIRLAFKYEGIYAHVWYLDNFAINAALPQYNINVEANNAAYGTVSGGGTFDQGATCTITATANSGYEFKKWTKDGSDVSTSESYTFTVTEDATYVAVFGEPAVTYYTVSTAANPAAGGTVTGGGTYASGTEVTLTATPNEGYEFVKWNDNNTDNPRTITVTGDVTYTAYFELKTYNLSVSANPVTGGNVTGGGNYPYGEYVTITATPNEGYQFLNWNDGVTQASRTVRVISDATYVAHFADVTTTTYTVTVVSGDPTMGTVTGGGTYPEGSEITISASPFGTNVFKKWDDDNTDNPRTVTVTADVTYTAIFEAPTLYTITVVSLNPEMGSVSGGGNFPMGAEVTIQANPLGGYYFDGWNDNNYDNPRTVTVTGNATYSAKFSAQQAETFMLTVTCNPMHGYVEGGGNYLSGTNVTVTAVPYDGYEFDHWNDNVTQNPRTVTVSNNMTLVAFFKATGVGENGETVMSLYPNPAKESIRLKGIESNSEVVIYNTLGMMVKTVNANAEQEISVSDLAAGVYTVRCGHQVLRFVKE